MLLTKDSGTGKTQLVTRAWLFFPDYTYSVITEFDYAWLSANFLADSETASNIFCLLSGLSFDSIS